MSENKRKTILGFPVVEVDAMEPVELITLATVDEVYGPDRVGFCPKPFTGEISFNFSFEPGPAFAYHAGKLPTFELVDEITGAKLGTVTTKSLEKAEDGTISIVGTFQREGEV